MKNYNVKAKEWQPLSDIMGQDYDHTKAYTVHANSIGIGFLCYLKTTETPDNDIRGKELAPFSDVSVVADTGDKVYFKGSVVPVNVFIEDAE